MTSEQYISPQEQEFLAEREEILKHKWCLSEARQEDVGFENALFDWLQKHRPAWKKAWRKQNPLDKATRLL